MDLTPIVVNGYDTLFAEACDDRGNYIIIAIPPHADKDISDICGARINGHLITQIDYLKINNNRFIKAYY